MTQTDIPHYGYSLMKETGLKSGTLYPILMRLKTRGYLKAEWDLSSPTGRPPRQHYELTPLGINYAPRYNYALRCAYAACCASRVGAGHAG